MVSATFSTIRAALVNFDPELSSIILTSIQLIKRVLRVSSVVISHECESARSSSSSLCWKIDISNLSKFVKERLQILSSSPIGQIIHPQRHHTLNIRRRTPISHDSVFSFSCRSESSYIL